MSHPENYGRFKQIFGVRDEQTHQGIVSMMRTEMGFLKLRYSKDAREAADELAFRDVAAVAFQNLSGAEEPEQGILEMQKPKRWPIGLTDGSISLTSGRTLSNTKQHWRSRRLKLLRGGRIFGCGYERYSGMEQRTLGTTNSDIGIYAYRLSRIG